MILIIDNYDSFTYNLAQYFMDIGAEVRVIRNDEISIEQIKNISPTHIVLSPGPGNPMNVKDFGVCKAALEQSEEMKIPILGVCLGHQGIIAHFGGRVVRNSKPMHGKTSQIETGQKGIFDNIPKRFQVMRYHSLIGVDIPSCLEVTATSLDDQVTMAVQHKILPIFGVQFHPESIMTENGKKILTNFVEGRL